MESALARWSFVCGRRDPDAGVGAVIGAGVGVNKPHSLGVGFSLPALDVALVPLIAIVAVTTIVFTLVGLRFGEILGETFRKNAERTAGAVLVALAALFTLQHLQR